MKVIFYSKIFVSVHMISFSRKLFLVHCTFKMYTLKTKSSLYM